MLKVFDQDILFASVAVVTSCFFVLSFLKTTWWEFGNGKVVHMLDFSAPVLLVIPLVVFWTLNNHVLNNGFLSDDPCLLLRINETGILPSFWDKSRRLSGLSYTPLFNVSFGADYYLFGLKPSLFYWHHLISLSITIVLIYLSLRLFLSSIISSFVTCLFVASASTSGVADQLMTRHYVEGLALSLISITLFYKGYKYKKNILIVCGSIAYLLACLAKEVYVPIVIGIVFLPIGTFKDRIKMIYPYIAMLSIYVLCRINILDNLLSTYDRIDKDKNIKDIFSFYKIYARCMDFSIFQKIILILISIKLALYALFKDRMLAICLFVWCSIILIPIMPVMSILADRLIFVFTLFVYVCVGITISYVIKKRLFASFLMGCILFAGFESVARFENEVFAWRQRYKAEGRFLLTSHNAKALLIEKDGHCLAAYPSLREEMGLGGGPKIAESTCEARAIFSEKFDTLVRHERGSLINIPAKDNDFSDCGGKNTLLTVNLKYHPTSPKFEWEFGVYPIIEGEYYISSVINGGIYRPIKNKGNSNMRLSWKHDQMTIKFKSHDGYVIYSKPLRVLKDGGKNIDGSIELHWESGDVKS